MFELPVVLSPIVLVQARPPLRPECFAVQIGKEKGWVQVVGRGRNYLVLSGPQKVSPRHAPRASTCKRPKILCRTRACPDLCTFCCTWHPSSCPRTLAPACSNLTRALCSPIDAIGRRREREQLPPPDCSSARGCHSAWRIDLSAARGELLHDVWVPGGPLNSARTKSADV